MGGCKGGWGGGNSHLGGACSAGGITRGSGSPELGSTTHATGAQEPHRQAHGTPKPPPPRLQPTQPSTGPLPRVPTAGLVALCRPTPLQIQPRGLAASHRLKITPAFRGAAGDLAGGFGRGEEFTAPPCAPPHRLRPIWPHSASAPACHPGGWGHWPAAWGQGCHGVWGTRVCLERRTLPVEVGKLRHRGWGTALPRTLRGSPEGRRGPSAVSSCTPRGTASTGRHIPGTDGSWPPGTPLSPLSDTATPPSRQCQPAS